MIVVDRADRGSEVKRCTKHFSLMLHEDASALNGQTGDNLADCAFTHQPLKRTRTSEEPTEGEELAREPTDDGDGGIDDCPICFEPWTTGGLHRVCSLRCGHLFGKHCVETWLSSGGRSKCPQCNVAATKKDIRVLFVKNLGAIDTSEQDALAKQLEESRMVLRRVQEREAKLQASYNLALAEISILRERVSVLELQEQSGLDFSLARIKFVKAVNFHPDTQSRCAAFSAHLQMFAIGMNRQSAQGSRSKEFGIGKVSLLDTRIEYIQMHEQLIKSLCCSPHHDGTVLSTSFDRTLKLTSLGTNSVLLSYNLESPGWSCAYDLIDRNCLFVGQANGAVCMFDVRNTRGAVWSAPLRSRPDEGLPIHSLHHSQGGDDTERFLLAATVRGSVLAKISAANTLEDVSYTCDDSCSSLITMAGLRHSLLTTRGARPYHRFWRQDSPLASPEQVARIDCKYLQPNMVRPSMDYIDQSGESIVAALPDGPTASVVQLSRKGIQESTSLATNSASFVLDSICARVDGKVVVGLLSERQFNLFS